VVFVLNKWDEMPDLKNSFEAARDKLRYFFGQMAWAPVLPLSARDGIGVDKLLTTLITIYAQLAKVIETSRLMKAVTAWIVGTPPPTGPKTKWKLRYAVQTSSNPQRFTFFVTKPEAVADSYVSFLRNKIREDLGLDKIPVILELKASRQGWNERVEDRRTRPAAHAKVQAAGPSATMRGATRGSSATSPRGEKAPETTAPKKKAPAKKVPKSRQVKPAAAKKAQKPDNRRRAAREAKSVARRRAG
jgi:GTP-binding protein